MRAGLQLALLLVLPLLHSARTEPDDADSLNGLARNADERSTVLNTDPIVKPKRDYKEEANAHAQDNDPISIPKRERREADPHAQVPGVLVPQPVQLMGPDGGRLVQPISQMFYSYMVNPFETYINQMRQTPVQYQHQNPVPQAFNPSQRIQVNQPFFEPYSQPVVQQPQFFQAPGQQPFVYHPNFVQQPQYEYQKYLNPGQLPQQQFGRPSSAQLYEAPQPDAGFDRGHIEAYPHQLQDDTLISFRKAQEESTPGLISRDAVEFVPIAAQVYSSPSDDGGGQTRFDEDSDSGSFSRGDVESYPAILKPLPYTTDDYQQESIIREGDGYGSYGLAGFRQAVESPPVFTAQHDPAEAYPMPVKANSRPFGQVSESFLYDARPQSYVPRPDFYSYSNPRVVQAPAEPGYKIICYYESWSVYRPQPLDFSVGDIDPFACTHLLYSFAGLEETNYTIVSLDPDYDVVTGGYKAAVSLKAQNPELKVMIAIGGWNEGGRKYSRMVSSKEYRDKFVKSVVNFLEEHHFDGLDLDWEYPAASDRGGRFSDKENFASLVKELSEEFKPKGWLLSAAVSPAKFRVNEGYDVPTLGMYLDFINVMTYDLRGPWDGKADHHSPIASKDSDSWAYKTLNVKDGMHYWAEKGAPRNKLVLGIPFYGRTFTLSQGDEAEPGARASSGGFEGRYTKERGLFAYYEVCQEQRNGGWIKKQDEVGGPYMVKKDQWVGYDDSAYVTKKMDLVRSEGYGGAMIWAIDLDDYLGLCGSRWPLLSAIRSSLADGGPPVPQEVKPIQGPRPVTHPDPGTQPEPAPEPEAEPAPEPEAEPAPEPEAEPAPEPETKSTAKPEPAPSTDSTRDTPSSTSPVSVITEASVVASDVPSMTCSIEGAYIPDESDCSSYYMCVHGEYQRFTCQTPLQWNRNKNVCDWEKNARCTSAGGDTPPSGPSAPVGGGVTLTTTTTQRPIPSVELEPVAPQGGLSGDYMVVCYFTNWAWYRPGIGKYKPDDIDPTICTHIVYGFAVLDYSNLIIKPHDSWADLDNKFYEKVTALRRLGIKVTLAIGGWNDSAGDKYSRLVNDPAARRKFIDHVIPFIEKYGFDGLDLDWEYPRCWQVDCNKGPSSDKQAFADWIRELSEAFKPKGLLLSAAVSPSKKVIDEGYDVPALNRYLDWIAVMTYDYHGQWDKKTGHVAPSYNHPDDDIDYFNMDFTIRYWLEKGASKNKIVLGMPMYGQSFTLNNADVNGLNAPARSGGTAGEFTRAKGFLAYYEICDRVRNKGWTVVKDPENRMGPYAYSDNQWVSYDDVDTIRRKSQYIRDLGLAGGMIWALDLDDFRNRCGQGAHPLMNTIKAVLGPSRSASGPVQRPTDIIPAPPTPPQITQVANTTVSSVTSAPIVPPPAPPSSDEYKVVCYFTNWAWYRQGEGKYKPEDIDPSLCTHIIYGFAVLDNSRLLIKPHDTWADFDNKFYEQVTSHKQRGVKVLVAIGGWNDSLGPKYSKLVNDPQARRRFTEHVIEFILKHNFDGLDLDWEYPVCWQVDCKKGPASDKDAFSAWIMELSAAFKPRGLLLSAAVSPSNKVMDLGYDIPVLSRYLDWIAVMTYDYHGQWDKKTGHVAPMYAHPEDENRFFNTNYTINYWIQGGADRKKIVMGMPMYGQSFTLSQASDNTLNKASYGGGEAGPYTRARGFLAYYEICYFIKNQDWTVVRDPYGTMGPYAYRGNQWVGFDDVGVIQYKSEYIKRMGLGGGMIWALDLDDFRNRCGCEEHPLLRTINRVLRGYSIPDPGCPVLGGGSPSSLQPFGSSPHEAVPTTTTTTTVPPWMTQWTPAPTTSRTTTRSPWEPPKSTSRAPWLPPSAPSEAPSPLPQDTTDRTTSTAITRPAETGEACEVGEYKAHESDCSMFYQCNQGKFEERKCFPGLHWAKTRCDWPKNTHCASAPSIETPVPLPPGVPSVPPMVVTSTSAPPPAKTTTAMAITPTKMPYPIVAPDPSGYKVVCYFTNWAWYRQGAGKYTPADIDPSLCTHIVYGFAVLDGSRLLIKPHDTWADYDNKFYEKVTELKKNGVKVLIAIGGWNDSAGGKYSKLVNSPEARRRFTEHVLEFVLKHNFDGLDLDWEYPKCWQVECDKGPESDKPAFSAWIKELHEAFQPHRLLLSAAVSPSYKVIDAGYDVPALNRYLDWIAVMTYDYHGHWDKKTGHVAPMFHHPESEVPEFNANYTIHYWLQHGADRKKLVMGMPMYGQSFSLASGEDNGYNAKSYGRGEAGEFTRAGGFLAYYEICDRILNKGYTVVRDPQGSIGPYAYKGGQWFGFDDISMIRYKSEYIKQMGLGGGMIWALDLDDFRNRCGCEEHPLLRTINRVLRGYSIPDPGCTI